MPQVIINTNVEEVIYVISFWLWQNDRALARWIPNTAAAV